MKQLVIIILILLYTFLGAVLLLNPSGQDEFMYDVVIKICGLNFIGVAIYLTLKFKKYTKEDS